MKIRKLGLAVALTVWGVALCMATAHATDDTLYHDLGERRGIKHIVDNMITHVLSDDRIKTHFEDTNIDRLKGMLVNYFQKTVGGPDVYKGSTDMAVIHRGMHLRNADFNAVVEDLQKGMDESGVPFATQNRFLALLAPKQKAIVSR